MMATPGSDESLVLADGRVLEYWEGGDPNGRPMIFHPGTPVTRLFGRWGHEAAVAAGVRLVSVNRPGYGGSTSSTAAPSLLAVGRDTAALAAHLGLDGYVVFGSSGGGPFAVATAVADPGAVRALGLVGGVGPLTLLDGPSAHLEDRECLALLASGDTAGAWACFGRQVERDRGSLTPHEAVAAIMGGDKSSLVNDASYRAIWIENWRLVRANFRGYVFDNLAWGGSWDVDPRDVVAPALLWYGTVDEHCPAASHGQWYADRIAGSRLVIVPSTGHFDVIDAHWPEVLAGLHRIWGSSRTPSGLPQP
jgi:pimeloyl-ACP methyl ester carboxylesterase